MWDVKREERLKKKAWQIENETGIYDCKRKGRNGGEKKKGKKKKRAREIYKEPMIETKQWTNNKIRKEK